MKYIQELNSFTTHKLFDTNYRLIEDLKEYATYSEIMQDTIVKIEKDGDERLYMIHSGYFSLHRTSDDLMIFIGQSPAVLGLSSLFRKRNFFYMKTLSACDCYCVSYNVAIDCFEKNKLWRDVSELLAYYTELWTVRDQLLVGVSSYTSVKALLIDYSEQPAVVRQKVNIIKFIIQRSGLSRSLVMNILSGLKRGGYIEMTRGRLTGISRLPDRW